MKNIAGVFAETPGNKTFTGEYQLPKNGADICQEITPDNNIGDIVIDKDFACMSHRSDYRYRAPLDRETRRCSICGALCAVGSWEVHYRFCKSENPDKLPKISNQYIPDTLLKIIDKKNNGKNGVK